MTMATEVSAMFSLFCKSMFLKLSPAFLLAYLTLFTFQSCKKDSITSRITPVDKTLSVSHGSQFELVDLDNDGEDDIKLEVVYIVGSSGRTNHSKITALGSSEISFVSRKDTSWYYAYGDTNWSFNLFKMANPLEIGDKISNNKTFSTGTLTLADASGWGTNAPPIRKEIARNELIGKGNVFIAIKLNNRFSWIKVEVLGFHKLKVHSFMEPISVDQLIISD